MATILMLTGVTRPEEVARAEVQPDWVFAGLRELLSAIRTESG
jgi:ribonucleotide monophosphatase NagD (HAD superfamily)